MSGAPGYLAAIAEAALLRDLTGCFPVGDDEPCPSLEISTFAATLLGVDPPVPSGELPAGDTRGANRRVDGRAIRRLLGVELRYPNYREGLRAALAEESKRASAAVSESAPA